jgi:hypothetical protein
LLKVVEEELEAALILVLSQCLEEVEEESFLSMPIQFQEPKDQ